MAELNEDQRLNAAGEVVEYNKDSDTWEPVDKDAPTTEEVKAPARVEVEDDVTTPYNKDSK